MSQSNPTRDEQFDLATITADDLLLDGLGRGDGNPGDAAPAGDAVAAMLAAWHAEVSAGGPEAERDADLVRAAIAAEADGGTTVRPRPFRFGRRLLGAAAAVVAAAGLALGSHQAGPTSPLWPLAQVMYPQQAEVRVAEYAIERARAAAVAGRHDEARRLLDEARTHLTRIDDRAVATRLRADLDTLLRDLPALNPGLPASTPTPPPAPAGTPTHGAVPPPEPDPTGGPVTPRISPAPQGPLPGPRVIPDTAPALPVPTVPPVPDPSASKSSLPDLPLPTGRLLD